MSPSVTKGSRWTQGSAGLIHIRMDNLLVLLVHMDCPLTEQQRLALSELHSFIMNIHSELAYEPITCDYVAYLKDQDDPESDLTYRL